MGAGNREQVECGTLTRFIAFGLKQIALNDRHPIADGYVLQRVLDRDSLEIEEEVLAQDI